MEIAELSCKLLLSRGLVRGVTGIGVLKNTDGESVLVHLGVTDGKRVTLLLMWPLVRT